MAKTTLRTWPWRPARVGRLKSEIWRDRWRSISRLWRRAHVTSILAWSNAQGTYAHERIIVGHRRRRRHGRSLREYVRRESGETALITTSAPSAGAQVAERLSRRREIVPTAPDGSLTIVARSREEMSQSQGQLLAWCQAKLADAQEGLDQAEAVLAQAKRAGLDTRAATRLRRRALRRWIYFDKLTHAVAAGYTIVPPMLGGTTVAIRTRKRPPGTTRDARTLGRSSVPQIELGADLHLPRGEGRMVSPRPEQRRRTRTEVLKDGGTRTHYRMVSTGAWRAPELPAELCRPRIVESMERAIELGVFDELVAIGVRGRDPDPLLCGLIRHHNPIGTWAQRSVWFLLAWWIDTQTLE